VNSAQGRRADRGPSTPLRCAQDFGLRLGRRQIASSSARKSASPLKTFYVASLHEAQSRTYGLAALKAFLPQEKTHRPKPVRLDFLTVLKLELQFQSQLQLAG
jgi:hypothetical protein